MELKEQLIELLKKVLHEELNVLDHDDLIMIEIPKETIHGDYSTNIALRLTKILHSNPKDIALKISEGLKKDSLIKNVEIAGPGFINLFLNHESLGNLINDILLMDEKYGSSNFGNNEKIMVEYVSANPTGDLHLGHARGAAYGDSLTRVLKFEGYDVLREYYVNDAGNQIDVLGLSLYERYKEALNLPFDLEKIGYQGKDVKELAKQIVNEIGDKYVNDNSKERFDYFKKVGTKLELDKIKKDLDLYRVSFDHYQSELEMYSSGKVENALKVLKESKYTYELDGALWLKTTEFGDDKDRVLVKKDGSYTYLLPDIAYHKDKFDRGYNNLLDILGADHHGYTTRLRTGLEVLGYDSSKLNFAMIQIVRLMENGEEVKMSKRTGNAVTIRELCDDVGVDVARYFFVSKPIVSHLDFDLNLARKNSSDNPIYYIQYAYARCCSILTKSNYKEKRSSSYELLELEKEKSMLKHLGDFKETLIEVCKHKEVNILTNYIYKLAQIFHSYYNDTRIIDETDLNKSNQRMDLIKSVSVVLKNALNLLGIEAKKVM